MKDKIDTYNSLMSTSSLANYDTESALSLIGQLVDLSFELKRVEGLKHAVGLHEEMLTRDLRNEQSALLDYFLGVAWQDLKEISKRGTEGIWDWEQEEIQKALIHYRRALQHAHTTELPKKRSCQILTNLANLHNEVGRFIEAIEYWNKALAVDPSFAMALGNKGYGLICYARSLYDEDQAALLIKYAYEDLRMSLLQDTSQKARDMFDKHLRWVESRVRPDFLKRDIDVSNYSLGKSPEEVKYRQWCLAQGLFLNPLNDLGPYPIAAHDVLHTPNIVAKIDGAPYYQAFFNQLKQEFVSARYLFWEAIEAKDVHFSDRGVLLFNTLDYPAYSLAVEKVKVAYRVTYSLFDKIAFFLNHYSALSIRDDQVNFRTVWYKSQKRKKGLRTDLECCPNWPLRGLFWLSKDFYENKPGFKETIEPDAQALSEIRNHLEHRYLKLHEDYWEGPLSIDDGKSFRLTDPLAYSMYWQDFYSKALRLLKIARAALIYLSLAIHREEKLRAEKRDPDLIIPPMELYIQEDDWKI